VRVSAVGVRNAYGAESRPAGAPLTGYGDSGPASRFFYVAKPSPLERDALDPAYLPRTRNARKRYQQDAAARWRPRARNRHPTVKPIDLMRWIIRLIARPGSVIVDPFAGSGSTGAAAMLEGMHFVGIDQDQASVIVGRARVAFWASFPVGTTVERALAQEITRRRGTEEATERRRELAAAGQLDLLAGTGGPHG
jgi:hypothetical protein